MTKNFNKTKVLLLALLLFCATGFAQTNIITTVAGTGTCSYSGNGGPATAATLRNNEGGVACFGTDVYIADVSNHVIRKINAAGIISVVAGTGTAGFTGDGIAATASKLNNPRDVFVDGSGNLYIADSWNHRIRKVSTAGIITTVAGTGVAGFTGDGPALARRLNDPYGVCVDGSGDIFIADAVNQRIRKVSSGTMTTIAGTGTAGYSGDGGAPATATISAPGDIAVETSSGDIYIAEIGNHCIRIISGGVINTFAGTGTFGFSGDGGAATSANLQGPMDVVIGPSGDVYIADAGNYRVRVVSGGNISTFAGTGVNAYSGDWGPAIIADMDATRLAFNSSGHLFVSSGPSYCAVRKIAPHECIDSITMSINSVTNMETGGCDITANATAYSINHIVAYKWSGASMPAVIHRTHATTDAYNFTMAPGTSDVVTVTVYVVDTNFIDTNGTPCCQAELTRTVTCSEGGEGSRHAMLVDPGAKDGGRITVFPNPAGSMVSIASAEEDINSIEVLDINGRKVSSHTYEHTRQTSISLDKLPPGTYLVRVNGTTTKVLMKE